MGTTKATISYSLELTKSSVSIKGGGWLNHIGSLITLCARATRAILNHAPIGEFRKRFKLVILALTVGLKPELTF